MHEFFHEQYPIANFKACCTELFLWIATPSMRRCGGGQSFKISKHSMKSTWEGIMLRIAIIVGSTRPGRKADAVARWVHQIALLRNDAVYELVDIQDFNLPLLDEAVPPSMGQYAQPHTKAWAAKIASYDGFVFVTPEYNHSTSGALKNAIDFLFAEWNNKAAGFVSYGSAGGVRAVESLRLVMGEIKIADVRAQVMLSLHTDFENFTIFKPAEKHEKTVSAMLDEVVAWSDALQGLRLRDKQTA
jgi:NAD(P)H-dependent FMN reductase